MLPGDGGEGGWGSAPIARQGGLSHGPLACFPVVQQDKFCFQ